MRFWALTREATSFAATVAALVFIPLWAWHELTARVVDWRPAEYRKLESVRPGFLIEKYRDQFGPAVARWADPAGTKDALAAEFFQGRDYWVQAVYQRGTGTVVAWSVTSCSDDFRPTMDLPGGELTLWRSSFADAQANGGVLGPDWKVNADYYEQHTWHQESRFLEVYPTNQNAFYHRLVWGVLDVCGLSYPETARTIEQNWPSDEMAFWEGDVEKAPPELAEFRRGAVLNTYGEAMARYTQRVRSGFGLGIWRSVTSAYVPGTRPGEQTTPSG